MKRLFSVLALGAITLLAGCVSPPPRANDPYYAPVLPRTPLPAAAKAVAFAAVAPAHVAAPAPPLASAPDPGLAAA